MESMALNAPGATERPQSFTTNSPAPSAASLGPSGATAQTSGFAQAGRKDSATAIPSQFGYLADPASGGGLASSPNVPKPGSTINLATGKPHVEDLTRAELAAIQSKGKGLLDPTPQPEAARRSSIVECVLAEEEAMEGTKEGRRLSDLSGREQAARQLMGTAGAGTGSNNSVQSTPGIEMPGGWGRECPIGRDKLTGGCSGEASSCTGFRTKRSELHLRGGYLSLYCRNAMLC